MDQGQHEGERDTDPALPDTEDASGFFTKPLQGALLTKFRDIIMGYEHVGSLDLDPMPGPEERVGSERADGRGTDGPDDVGFTLVVGKKKCKVSFRQPKQKVEEDQRTIRMFRELILLKQSS